MEKKDKMGCFTAFFATFLKVLSNIGENKN